MTLDQLAALLDQLKRPIEEAPKGPNKPAIWACRENDQWMVVFEVEHSEVYGWCGYNNTNYFVTGLTHFLPLPKPGPVEFEVVPKGTVEVLSGMCEVIHSGRCATRGGELWSLADKAKVILGGKD